MSRYKPWNLRQKGLKAHLDETAADHNGRGYAEFVRLMTEPDQYGYMLSKAKVARLFGVSRETLYEWLKVYQEEQVNSQ